MVSEQVLAAMQAASAARGAAVLAIVLDGVRGIISNARAGDPEAKKSLRHLRGLAREIDALAGGLELPGD